MLLSDNSAILAQLDWTPRHADLDGIVRDALAWERKLDDGAVRARPKR
ncbi:UDP-glucose 4-epimerase [Sphingomonas faeni]|nr:UDP-glucose 4-epimerase [Sphingomonas faeni]